MSRAQPSQLVIDLSAHPGLAPLSQAMLQLAERAWRSHDVLYPRPGSETLRSSTRPARELLTVGDNDLSEIFNNGATTSAHYDLLVALTLMGVSAAWPGHEDAHRFHRSQDLTRCLLWLESFSGLHCLSVSLSVYDGQRLRQLGESLLELLTAADISPTEQQIAKAWLSTCAGPDADLATRARAIVTRSPPAQLGTKDQISEQPLQGQLGPQPRSTFGLTMMALSGLLFLSRLGTAIGRWVLLRRCPTTCWLSERGLELEMRHEMLGRRLRERRVLLPIEAIQTVEREIRFPRFGLYAGLTALTVGTLLGSRLFVDGLRVAGMSLPLIAMGTALVVLGVLLDLALSGAGESLRGRCRIVITTHHGRGWTIGDLEPQRVDSLLTELSNRLSAQRA
ncbi:MAG TPA: hypothetical protein VIV60_22630 [Polyangiaceae bacterium]